LLDFFDGDAMAIDPASRASTPARRHVKALISKGFTSFPLMFEEFDNGGINHKIPSLLHRFLKLAG
jgi:hypothetical protein